MKYQITNKIKLFRLQNDDMSQDKLANLTGVSRQTINAIEKDKYSPSLELAFKIALVFNVTVNDVFFYEEEKK
ncbi:helix-turn-helix transcriptional regulator [Acholeplasma granularum]|uniref:helix-turn-helix transcriptional regulator n=1 Tax=Acholeplasma granularum TaxID=264635 RepID=UPI0004BC818D|nr:helix-turn-helix transcriptional regulator [Acholeplasma granularum]